MNRSRKSRAIKIKPEQVTFAIAALIVAALVGLVLLSWVSQSNQPPMFSIQPQPLRESQGQYYLPFSITNQGGQTATSVQVIGELKLNGKVEETGEQQIDFLSGNETAEGAFIFSQDPRTAEVVIRAASYGLP